MADDLSEISARISQASRSNAEVAAWLSADAQLEVILESSELATSAAAPIAGEYTRLL